LRHDYGGWILLVAVGGVVAGLRCHEGGGGLVGVETAERADGRVFGIVSVCFGTEGYGSKLSTVGVVVALGGSEVVAEFG
jgi:hypothetical protein